VNAPEKLRLLVHRLVVGRTAIPYTNLTPEEVDWYCGHSGLDPRVAKVDRQSTRSGLSTKKSSSRLSTPFSRPFFFAKKFLDTRCLIKRLELKHPIESRLASFRAPSSLSVLSIQQFLIRMHDGKRPSRRRRLFWHYGVFTLTWRILTK